jgi:U4/U6 small nuclear ribonucleoprotein PRP31
VEGEEEIEGGVGLGMLSQGTGKLKVNIKKQKLNVSKKMTQRMNKKSGLESSLNLGASQGIELINPLKNQSASGGDTIFSKAAGFQTVLNNKFGTYK